MTRTGFRWKRDGLRHEGIAVCLGWDLRRCGTWHLHQLGGRGGQLGRRSDGFACDGPDGAGFGAGGAPLVVIRAPPFAFREAVAPHESGFFQNLVDERRVGSAE